MTYELPANANPDNKLENPTADDIVVLPGAAELLRALADASVPTAIVTSGTRDLAEARAG